MQRNKAILACVLWSIVTGSTLFGLCPGVFDFSRDSEFSTQSSPWKWYCPVVADSFPVYAVLFCSLGLVAPALAWLFSLFCFKEKVPVPEPLPVPHCPRIPVVPPVQVQVLATSSSSTSSTSTWYHSSHHRSSSLAWYLFQRALGRRKWH